MPSAVVDGMDVRAVRDALDRAVARARAGDGPRWSRRRPTASGALRADTAPYRPEGELEHWRTRDPLVVARRHLLDTGTCDEAGVVALEAQVRAELDAVVERTQALPAPGWRRCSDTSPPGRRVI
jgi:pyruvate dehydrogenase E1 component alpha subunit